MLDLNRIREVISRNQAENNDNPVRPAHQVVVDKDGNMAIGDSLEAANQPTTKIPQETFANCGGLR